MSEENKDLGDKAAEALSGDNGKNVAIIAHITFIGLIIAFVMNSKEKTELGSFYIRQLVGIWILVFATSFIPFVNFVGWILGLVLWIMSIIPALSGEQKPVFLVGEHFQNWFKSL